MRPLDGIKVIEAASYISGPFASLALADLGAEVLKVEPMRGDPMRRFGVRRNGLSVSFAQCNANKKSMQLDLKTAEDTERFLTLVSEADVLVTNWRPRIALRLGLTEETVPARYPGLVWVRISGYGQSGPFADLPAFDSIVQARSGLGRAVPGRMALAPGYIADKVSAIIATQGVLAALLARSKTGRGAIVDVSMLDALAYFNAPDALAGYLLSDPAPEVMEHVSAVRPLQTADGFLVVSPVSGDQLRALVGAVGHPEWADELRACRSPVDMIHRMNELLEGVLRDRSTASWLDAFAHADVPASSLLTPAEHLADKQVAFNELYYCIQDSTLGEIRRPRHPALFNGRPAESDRLQVPVLQTDRSVGN